MTPVRGKVTRVSSKRIEPDKLTDVMMDLLKEYGDEVYDIVEDTAKDMARKATSELRQKSPGDYAKRWRHRAEKNGKTEYKETVFNTKYQLTHLLENEHKTGDDAGHYPKNPGSRTDHTGIIKEVEEKYADAYISKLVRIL